METEYEGSQQEEKTGHIRSSTALLVGRVVSLVIDFAAHVLAVRYLSKGDFGAYTYALAVVSLLSTTFVLGFPDTVSRFVPLYRSQGRSGRVVGTFLIAVGTVTVGGIVAIAAVLLAPGTVEELMGDPTAARMLAILVLVVPSDALNFVFQGLFAALGKVRIIFMRQYVIVPGLRFLFALALVVTQEDVDFLAIGYVVASALGIVWFTALLMPAIKGQLANRFEGLEMPYKETIAFAVPVFLTNAFWVVLIAFSTIALGAMTDATEVADLQAVLPPARLNYLAMAIFTIMFIPTIARLHAREEFDELRDTYMATTCWLVVFTVPILALTTVFASTFVPVFFGDAYDTSIIILVMLAAGYYLYTASGLNSVTLKIYRRLRYTVAIDVSALAAGIVMNLMLIPPLGASGAALAFLLAIIFREIPYTWALWRITGINMVHWSYLRVQVLVVALMGILLAVQLAFSPGIVAVVLLSSAAGLVALYAMRNVLKIESSFPELTNGRLGRLARPFTSSEHRNRP